jgi:predicted NAD-dependent protein-ADP-ribosyltransferase YbiA (DUF1768 family)
MSNTKFLFYSKSANVKAGYGTGEIININDDYTELNSINNWRKMLSNFYISPFEIDDNVWNSVEHFFHAIKFRNGKKISKNYDYYKTFTSTGNVPWSENSYYAKQAGKAGRISQTTGKMYSKKIENYKIPLDVSMRPDFYSNHINKKLETIAFLAKFTQNEDLKRMLLATKDAELWHFVGRGHPNILMENLMIVRNCIRKMDKKYDLNNISRLSTNIVSKVLNDY